MPQAKVPSQELLLGFCKVLIARIGHTEVKFLSAACNSCLIVHHRHRQIVCFCISDSDLTSILPCYSKLGMPSSVRLLQACCLELLAVRLRAEKARSSSWSVESTHFNCFERSVDSTDNPTNCTMPLNSQACCQAVKNNGCRQRLDAINKISSAR